MKIKFSLKNRKIVAVAAALLIATSFASWKVFLKKEPAAQYQTTTVERGSIISSISASGQLLSVNVLSASTKASGIVSQVFVKDGNEVRKGDKILEITLDTQGQQKNAAAWSSYLSAKNSLESAKLSLLTLEGTMLAAQDDFIKHAVDAGLPSNDPAYIQKNNDYLVAQAKYKNQNASISQAETNLQSSWLAYQQTSAIITAPEGGTITSLMYVPGMAIGTLDTGNTTSNQKVAAIKTSGTPVVSVNLSEIDVPKAALGQKATITVDSLPDKTFTGTILGIDKIGQTSSGVTQYPAIIKLDSSPSELLPNMGATAVIVIARKENVLLVPSSAVQEENGQSYVRVLKDKQPQSVAITVGLNSDTEVEIISGLSQGDLVITGTAATDTASQPSGNQSPFGSQGGGMFRMMR